MPAKKGLQVLLKSFSMLLGGICSLAPAAYAADLPQGGRLATGSQGQASITVSADQRTMTIQQKGAVAAILIEPSGSDGGMANIGAIAGEISTASSATIG